MNLKYGRQVSINEVVDCDFNLFLFANNVEKRKLEALYTIREANNVKRTVSLDYPLSSEPQIEDEYVESLVVTDLAILRDLIKNVVFGCEDSEINIFVDYSCMTKPWYYTILSYLAEKEIEAKTVNCYFSYTPSIYSEPLPPKQNTRIEPIEGSYKIPNNKPKALIVCLGYEQNKAQGIIDQLEPKLTYLYYTKPSIDDKFVEAIEENNKDILKEFKEDYVFTYPFDDIKYLEKHLTSLYYTLREDYHIIIAPLGPKPFTFASMILSIIFPEIEVWRVDSGLDLNRYIRPPFDPPKFIIKKIVFNR
jgi:hypothetical protein